MYLTCPISCWHVTRPSRHLVRLMNEKSVGEENQNTGRKTKSYVLSGLGNSLSRGWEGNSKTGGIATRRFWPFTWKISSVGKDLDNKWEFSVLKLHPMFVFEVFRHIFSSWALAPTQLTIFLWGLSILSFSLIIIKLTFLVSKGLFCLYDKQNNTRLLVDMEFLLSCSTRHLTRFLRSLVSYRVEYSKRNFTSTRVMYYSLCIDWVENGNWPP